MLVRNSKGYAIKNCPFSVPSKFAVERWRTKVVVRRVLCATAEDKDIELPAPETWSTYEKAIEYGFAIAEEWINRHAGRR